MVLHRVGIVFIINSDYNEIKPLFGVFVKHLVEYHEQSQVTKTELLKSRLSENRDA